MPNQVLPFTINLYLGVQMRKEKKMILNVSRRLLLDTAKTEKQIAKILYISETSLRQLYIQNFSKPPKRYIRHVKLCKAKTLIRTSQKTISEIAYDIGYINTSKFTEAFKNRYDITPSEYRKQCNINKNAISE